MGISVEWKHAVLVSIRKCFLLWNEQVATISIRDTVSIRLLFVKGAIDGGTVELRGQGRRRTRPSALLNGQVVAL
jgi:hypothetical protein